MQAKLLKIGLILFLVIGISGCGETVYLSTDNGTGSITVYSDFWYYAKVLSGFLIWLIGVIWIAGLWISNLSENSNTDKCTIFTLFFGSIVFFIVFFFTGAAFFPVPNQNSDHHVFTRSEFLANSKLVNASQRYQEISKTGLNYKEYQQRHQLGENGYDLRVQIDQAKQKLSND